MESQREEHENLFLFRLELLISPNVNLEALMDEIRRLRGVRAAEAQAAGSPLSARRLVEE